LKLSASDVFTQSDEPSQADRLDLRRGRQRFTDNLLSLTGDYVIDVYTMQGYYRVSTFWSDDTTVTHTPGVTASTILKNNTLTLGYECLNSRTTSDIPGNDSTITGHQVTATVSRDVTRDLTAGVAAFYAPREQQKATGSKNFTRTGAAELPRRRDVECLGLGGLQGTPLLSGLIAEGTARTSSRARAAARPAERTSTSAPAPTSPTRSSSRSVPGSTTPIRT
jgi:hypothetical protein